MIRTVFGLHNSGSSETLNSIFIEPTTVPSGVRGKVPRVDGGMER